MIFARQRHIGRGFHCGSSVTAVELLQGLTASLAGIRASAKGTVGKKKRSVSADKVGRAMNEFRVVVRFADVWCVVGVSLVSAAMVDAEAQLTC